MRLTLAVALLALFAAATAPPPQHVDVYQRPERAQRNRDYDVLRYRIELTFHQDARSFEGAATVTLRPLRDDFALCVLDAETFKVSRVVMEPGSAPLTFEQ